jgi:hypothetical protein
MKLRSFCPVVVVALFASSPALADAATSRLRYQQGVAAFSKGDFASAVAAFADVYRETGETKHLWNLALAESQAGSSYDALLHLRQYVSKPDANPKNVERAHQLITGASANVGHVTVTAPDGADVLLDGMSVGSAPLPAPLDVDPAKPHVIVAQRGADTARQTLAATGPSTVRVELEFPVSRPAPAPVVAVPAVAPSSPHEPPPSAALPVPAAEQTSNGGGSAVRTWMTVGLGAGALAALAGGIAMGLSSNSSADRAQQLRSGMQSGACSNPSAAGCSQLASDNDSATSDHTAAVVLYAGAGVLAAGALASFLFLPHGRASDVRGALVPVVTPGGVGAGYVGVF